MKYGKPANITRIMVLVIAALLIPVIPFLAIGELPGQSWLNATDNSATTFAATGAALLAIDILLPVPSSIVGTLMGARLGLMPAWLWATAGLLTGNLLGYLVGRLWPSSAGLRMADRPGLVLVLLSRPIPVVAEAVVLLSGATRMNMPVFIAGSAIGNAFYALFLSYNGSLQASADRIWTALVVAMLLPVLGYCVWKYCIKTNDGCAES